MSFAIIAAAVATRIDKPLTWWRTHLSDESRRLLARLWLWPFLAFLVLSFVDLEIAVVGDNPSLINTLPPFVFAVLFLGVVAGFAHDIDRQTDSHQILF